MWADRRSLTCINIPWKVIFDKDCTLAQLSFFKFERNCFVLSFRRTSSFLLSKHFSIRFLKNFIFLFSNNFTFLFPLNFFFLFLENFFFHFFKELLLYFFGYIYFLSPKSYSSLFSAKLFFVFFCLFSKKNLLSLFRNFSILYKKQ